MTTKITITMETEISMSQREEVQLTDILTDLGYEEIRIDQTEKIVTEPR